MSGLSPGTAAPSPRAFWDPKNDKPSEATSVLRSSVRMLRVNFIVRFGVWEEDEAILMAMGLDDWMFGEAVVGKVAGRR